MPRIPFLSTLQPTHRLARGWVWAVMPWLLTGALAWVWTSFKLQENDAFLHLQLGQWMLDGGPSSGNPDWVYGPNIVWHNTMAFVEVVYAFLYEHLGWGGVDLLFWVPSGLLLPLTWYAFTRVAPRPAVIRGPGPARVAVGFLFIVLLMSVAGVVGMTARPMSMSLAVTPLLTVALVRLALTGRWPSVWLMVPLTWLWASWHGYGMLVGPLMFGAAVAHVGAVFLTSRKITRWAEVRRAVKRVSRGWVVLLGALAVTFVTPSGVHLWGSAFAIREASKPIISEWQPTGAIAPTTLTMGLLLSIWVAGVMATGFAARRAPRMNAGTRRAIAAEGLLILGLSLVLVGTYRTSSFLVVLLVVIVANRVMRVPQVRNTRPHAWEAWSGTGALKWVIVAFPIMAAGYTMWQVHVAEVDSKLVPMALYAQMTEDFKDNPEDHRLLVHLNESSSASLFLPEEVQVSIDGRTDRYGSRILKRYVAMFYGDYGWDRTFDRDYSDSTDALIDRKYPLAKLLRERGWVVMGSQRGLDRQNKPMSWVWLRAPGS